MLGKTRAAGRSATVRVAIIMSAVLALVASLLASGAVPARADAWKKDLAGVDTVGAQLVTTTTYLTNVGTSSSSPTAKAIPNIDINALYGVDMPQNNSASSPYNVAIIDPSTGKNTVQFSLKAPAASTDQRTLGVDSGMGNGSEGFYIINRASSGGSAGAPAGMMPVWHFAPGDTKASTMYYVPDKGYYGFTSPTWTTGGIVVNQKTGMLYINTGLVQLLGPTTDQQARFSIFDPKTLTSYWSGPLQPATPADDLWIGKAIPDPAGGMGVGVLTSGIAITAGGDFVVLVKGTDKAIAANDPINTTGKAIPAGSNTIGFLVRVHPTFNNDPWTYSVMKMVSQDPADKSTKSMFLYNQQAMAFMDGKLIVEVSNGTLAFEVDPMTGYWKYLSTFSTGGASPVAPSPAPQTGLFYSLASAQTATSLTGRVFKSDQPVYNTSNPLPGVTMALYEQNPARGYDQPTLVGTTVTDSLGRYTFIVSDKNTDDSVKYFVRPIQPLIGGEPSMIVAGGELTLPPFGGIANQGTLFCSDGTKYESANDGVMVAGPCPGIPNPPALEAKGTEVDPTAFGAYGEITMRSEWDDPVIDFVVTANYALAPTITSPKTGDTVTTDTPEIKGTGITEGDTITVKDGAAIACLATVQANLSWSCTPATALPDGSHTLTATTTTAGGNTSGPSAPVTITVDTVPPLGPFSYTKSTFAVSPVATSDKATWVTADGVGAYTATLTAMDDAGNKLKDLATTDIAFAASSPAIKVTSVTNNNDGTYTASYTSTTADAAPTATVSYKAIQVGSAKPVPFKAGAAVTGPVSCADGREGTNLSVAPASAQAGGSVTATTLVTDAYCNPVPGVTVSYTATGAAVASPAAPVTGADGIAKSQISDNAAEVVDVTAAIPAGTVWNSPQPVTFLAGGFSWDKSYITVTPAANPADQATWVTADGAAAYTVKLYAFDAQTNPLPALSTSDMAFIATTADITVGSVTNNGDGTYSAKYTSKVADPSPQARVNYMSTQVGTYKPVPFKAGAPVTGPVTCDDPAKEGTNLTTTPKPLPAGETAYATALITDQFCNPVPGVPVTFTIDPGTTGILVVTGGTTDADGKAYASLTDTKAESVVLHAAIAAGEIYRSPRTIVFTAGGFSFANSTFTVAPAANLADKATWVTADGVARYAGTLKARDDQNNPITDLTAADLKFAASSTDVTVSAMTNAGNGDYVVYYTTTRADAAYTTNVAYNDHQVGQVRPIPFKAGAPVTSATCDDGRPGTNLSTDLPESGILLVGDPLTATALVTDAFCNPVAGAEVLFATSGSAVISDGLNSDQAMAVTTDENGLAVVTLTDPVGETVILNALLDGSDIKDSPVQVDYRTCTFSWAASTFTVSPDVTLGAPWVTADGVSAYTGTLTARDAEGDLLSFVHVEAADFVTSSPAVKVSDVINNGDGTFTVKFTSTVADATTVVTATHGGESDPAGAKAIPFAAGAPVAGPTACADGREGTNMLVAPKSVQAGGSATATVLVTDEFCNPVPGVPVSFGVDGSGSVSDGKLFTGPDGRAVATVTDNVAETINVSVAISTTADGGIPNDGDPVVTTNVWNAPQQLTFTPGEPVLGPVNCGGGKTGTTFSVAPASLTVGESAVATAYITDAYCNPVPGVTVDFGKTGSATLAPASAVTGPDGKATTTVADPVAETAQISASLTTPAGQIAGSPFPVTFAPGATITPDAPVITSPANNAKLPTNTPDVAGEGATPGDTIKVYDGDKVICTTTVKAGGAWDCVPDEPLGEGDHTLTATATNPSGTESAPSAPVRVTVDTVAPDAPVITDPANNAAVDTNKPVISGTGSEPGSTVAVWIADDPSGYIDAGSDLVCMAEVKADGKWSCIPDQPLAEGDHHLVATDTDKTGNESDPSDVVKITVDTVAPGAPTITDPEDNMVVGTDKPVIGGTGAEPGNVVTVTDGDKVVCTGTVGDDLVWSCEPDKPLAEGDHTLAATEKDPAGNVSAPSAPVTITVDTIAPGAPAITSPSDKAAVTTDKPVISGTGDEPGNTVTVWAKDPAGDKAVCTAVVQADGKWTCVPEKPLADGTYTLNATEKDPSGNVSAPSGPVRLTVDATAPDAPAITAPADNAVVGTDRPVISGTGSEPGNVVTVKDGDEVVCTGKVKDDLTWTCLLDKPLSEGDNVLTAVETDPVGNVSLPSEPVRVTVDTTVPVPSAPVITSPADGIVVETETLVVSGTGSKAGDTVTVYVKYPDGSQAQACSTAVKADLTWSCVAEVPLTGGDNKLTATETDDAGRVSAPSEPVTVVVDEPLDAPVITGPKDGTPVNTNKPVISGTASEPWNTVTVYDKDDKVVCTAEVKADLSWSCVPTTPLAEGPNTLTVVEDDEYGDSAPSAPITITVDTIAPSAPVITSPADGDAIKADRPVVSGTGAEPGNKITVSVTEPGSDVPAATCTAEVKADLSWSCVLDEPLADGTYEITATETDKAGNESAPSDPVNIVEDKVAPAAPAITAPKAGDLVATDKPVISGTGSVPGDVVKVIDGGKVICTTEVKADLSWSCELDKPLADGDHTLTATETDEAGNESAPSAPVKITVDTTAPDAPVVTSPKNGDLVATDKPVVSGTGSEAGDVVTVEVRHPGADLPSATCTATVKADLSWSCVLEQPLADGTYELTATEKDKAGNESEPSGPVQITVDTTAPDAPVVTSPKTGDLVATNKPVVSGTGSEPGDTVKVSDGDKVVCTTTVKNDLSWSCPLTESLPDGDRTLTATETDKAGNVSGPSAPVTITVDTTAPDAPAITSPKTGDLVATDKPVVTGTGSEIGDVVKVYDGDRVVCTTEVTVDLTWTCVLDKPLADGDHTLAATETDEAGNESSPSAPVRITVDTTAPDAPAITSPHDGSSVKTDKPVIAGTGSEPGNVITVLDGDKVICTTEVKADLSWACVLEKPLDDGAHTLSATETDKAGNESLPSAPILITVDTTPPGRPSGPVVDPSNGSQFTGISDPGTTVTVKDADGKPVAGCVDVRPDASGKFTCVPDAKLPAGSEVTVVARDDKGNESDPVKLLIRGLAMYVAHPVLYALDYQTVTGYNFNPGERVHLVVASNPLDGGYLDADEHGVVKFTFQVPGDFEVGPHTATLTGDQSGSVADRFQVVTKAVASTGGEVVVSGLPLGLVLAGLLLLLGGGAAVGGVVVTKRKKSRRSESAM